MPLISSFLGILIYMFKEKNSPHHKPHVHVVYAEHKCPSRLMVKFLQAPFLASS